MAAKDKKEKEKEAALPEGQAEKPRKKSKGKKIAIILAILLVTFGCAGMGAYWWLYMRSPVAEATQQAGEEKTEQPQPESAEQNAPADKQEIKNARIERQSPLPRSAGLVLPLPPITVNLADPNGRRYLKLGMEVEVNADVSNELKAQSPRIRDAIIMLLAGKTYGEVASPDGKVLLKAEIAARLNQILGAQRVVRVYFTDFVVE